jgi:hypothetical protein
MAWVEILELSRRYQWYVRGWADSGWSEDGPSESKLYTIRIFRSRSIIRAFAGDSLRKWVGGGREGCSEGHP